MAQNAMTSSKAIKYLNRLYGIKASCFTLRNWVVKGRGKNCLKAKTHSIGTGDRVGYTFLPHDLSDFVKIVGKDTLKNLKRGRPVGV